MKKSLGKILLIVGLFYSCSVLSGEDEWQNELTIRQNDDKIIDNLWDNPVTGIVAKKQHFHYFKKKVLTRKKR